MKKKLGVLWGFKKVSLKRLFFLKHKMSESSQTSSQTDQLTVKETAIKNLLDLGISTPD